MYRTFITRLRRPVAAVVMLFMGTGCLALKESKYHGDFPVLTITPPTRKQLETLSRILAGQSAASHPSLDTATAAISFASPRDLDEIRRLLLSTIDARGWRLMKTAVTTGRDVEVQWQLQRRSDGGRAIVLLYGRERTAIWMWVDAGDMVAEFTTWFLDVLGEAR